MERGKAMEYAAAYDTSFAEVDAEPERYELEFTGTAAEYFRIWIVNVVLTVVTLGIYGAWAKVRTRRYFYANTLLDGEPFDYLASPFAILKGYLIVLGGFLAYVFTQAYDPLVSGVIIIAFVLVFPYLIYKSFRFRAHNSAYRNIRFGFVGTVGQSYGTFLLLPILIPFTLGLIIPYWMFRQKHYAFDNFAFGQERFAFGGRAGFFYKTYFLAGLIAFGVAVGAMMVLGVVAAPAMQDAAGAADFETSAMLIALMMVMYIGVLVLGAAVQQYIYASLTNHCWNETFVGPIGFQCTLRAWPLIWIHVTNVLAIFFSLGLLIPWAKVRRTKYILANLAVDSSDSLNNFTAASGADESAIGDAAADFFDFEIGL